MSREPARVSGNLSNQKTHNKIKAFATIQW